MFYNDGMIRRPLRATLCGVAMALFFTSFGRCDETVSLADRLVAPDAGIRAKAVTEFNRLPHDTQEQFVPTLMVALSSDDPAIHDQAAALLNQLGKAPKTALDAAPVAPTENPATRQAREQQSFHEIQQNDQSRYKKMRQLLAEEKQGLPALPGEDAARDSSDPIRQALWDGLSDPDPFVRSRSAQRLGTLQPPMPEAVPALIQLLTDKNKECRGAAAAALGAMGSMAHDAIPGLRRLAADPDPNVSAIADAALRQVQGAP